MLHCIRVIQGPIGPEAEDDAGCRVLFDPDDPASVEAARQTLGRLTGGHSVPICSATPRRRWFEWFRRARPARQIRAS